MHDIARHLVERVLPDVGIRQYVLSPPSKVVGLLAARGEVLSALSRIFVDAVFDGIRSRSGHENLGWLGKHGYLGSEDGESEDSDAWWRAAAKEPLGLISTVPGKVRRAARFNVNAGVWVGQGDKVGRE